MIKYRRESPLNSCVSQSERNVESYTNLSNSSTERNQSKFKIMRNAISVMLHKFSYIFCDHNEILVRMHQYCCYLCDLEYQSQSTQCFREREKKTSLMLI